MKHPVTPDGRYFMVRGRLWRCTNPALSEERQVELRRELMAGWRAKRAAKLANDRFAYDLAKASIDITKRALGERGPVWWTDGAPDENRRMARNTSYASWAAEVESRTGDVCINGSLEPLPRGLRDSQGN